MDRTISIVIGYEHHERRLPLLLKCLSSLQDIEQICIVESGPFKALTRNVLSPVLAEDTELKYLKIYTSTPYNRAWNFNIGVRHLSTCDIVVLIDADLVFPPDFSRIVREQVTSKDYVGPAWNCIVYLSEKDTLRSLSLPRYEVEITSPSRACRPSKAGAAGGAFVCYRDTYFDFQGMDERFFGRTSEDNAHWAKLEVLGYKVRPLPVTLYHLYHPINPVIASNRSEVFDMLNWSKERWLEEINSKGNWGSIDGFIVKPI
ncbi:glycosyltransferase [bacterium]|nr:glycosyltransferase [bacterium]